MKTARLAAVLALAALAGCGHSHHSAKADAAKAQGKKAASVRKPGDRPAPRAASIKLGISADEARVAMGEPVRSRRMTSFDGTYDLYEYDGKNLRFKNGRLIEIQYVR